MELTVLILCFLPSLQLEAVEAVLILEPLVEEEILAGLAVLVRVRNQDKHQQVEVEPQTKVMLEETEQIRGLLLGITAEAAVEQEPLELLVLARHLELEVTVEQV